MQHIPDVKQALHALGNKLRKIFLVYSLKDSSVIDLAAFTVKSE